VEVKPTPATHGNEAHNPDMLPLSTSSAIDAYMSGNKWLSVATSGIVKLPRQSWVVGWMDNGGSYFSVTAGNTVKIPFDSVESGSDPHNEFDTTGHRFTATEDGLYLVSTNVTVSSLPSSYNVYVICQKNGTTYRDSFLNSADPSWQSVVLTFVIHLSAGDYLEFYVHPEADCNIVNGSTRTYFSIAKIA